MRASIRLSESATTTRDMITTMKHSPSGAPEHGMRIVTVLLSGVSTIVRWRKRAGA